MDLSVIVTGARQDGGPGMLVLCLDRTYLPTGTNGEIRIGRRYICSTIELPWRKNRRNVSCIPEGCYRLELHRSRKFGDCLAVKGVPRRYGILIHPANDAATELRGCIAPVTKLTGEGKGIFSRIALERLEREVMGALERGDEVWLEVLTADPAATGNCVPKAACVATVNKCEEVEKSKMQKNKKQ